MTKTKFLLAASAAAAMVSAPTWAAESAAWPSTRGAWSAQYGIDGNLHRLTVNYETRPLWSYPLGSTRLDLVGELGVSYWHYHGGHRAPGASKDAWQLSAIPMFQWWLTPRFYIEGGIGLTVFNTTHFGRKDLSTAFQFGDHIGVGYQLTDNLRVNARFSHFSNANIKRPNPGVNSYQIGLTMRW